MKLLSIYLFSVILLYGDTNYKSLRRIINDENINLIKIIQVTKAKLINLTNEVTVIHARVNIKDLNKKNILEPWTNAWGCHREKEPFYTVLILIGNLTKTITLECGKIYSPQMNGFDIKVKNTKSVNFLKEKKLLSQDILMIPTMMGSNAYLYWDGTSYKGIIPYETP